jgi:hypothetical protein
VPATDPLGEPPAEELPVQDPVVEVWPPIVTRRRPQTIIIWFGALAALVVLAAFLVISGTAPEEENGIEHLAQDVLAAFKDNDPDAFVDMVIDYATLMRLIFKKSQGDAAVADDPRDETSSLPGARAFKAQVRNSFAYTRRGEARLWDFRWGDVEFSKAEYELETKDGKETIPELRIAFTVPDDEREYELILDQLIKIKDRWLITGTPYGVVRDKLPLPLADVAEVTGQVIYNGDPLPAARVAFHPHEDNAPGTSSRCASAITDNEGRFSLTLEWASHHSLPIRITGAHPGTYYVTVSKIKQKQYATSDSPPPDDIEAIASMNLEFLAESGGIGEDGSDNTPAEENLINSDFRFPYSTRLKNVEVSAGGNDFTIEINDDGTGRVR